MFEIRSRSTAVTVCIAVTAMTAWGASSNEAEGAPKVKVDRLDAALRAVRTAERKVPRGTAYDIETDRLRGKRVWEVKVARGVTPPYELDVRADGRTVVRQRRDARIDDDVRTAAGAKITLARALTTAAARARGTRFDEAGIDRSRGRIVWTVEFRQSSGREVEVKVDALTGKVLAVVVDD